MSDGKGEVYVNGYHASVFKGHNWRTAENSCQHLLPALRELAQKDPNLTLLDIGCGSGSITVGLAQEIPSGQVTGMDISTSALAPAIALSESLAIQNLTFTPGDVYELPYPDNAFDAVHAQQLLGHLKNPPAAIREMLRVTRPGGIVALREMDLPTMAWWPESAGLLKWQEMLFEQIKAAGAGRIHSGREIKAWCKAAGAREEMITSSAGTWCWSTPEEREAWGGSWMGRVTGSEFATKAVDLGQATREELEELGDAWRAWKDDEDGWFGVLHGEALIRKV